MKKTKNLYTNRLLALMGLVAILLLGHVPPTHSMPPQARPAMSLIADPTFDRSALSSDMQVWYDRLWLAINSGETYPDPEKAAQSGDLYAIGRTLNAHITALLTAFRVTGDYALLDRIDFLMEQARGQLEDYNGDGFRNWRWLRETDSQYYGDDWHHMDEMLAHSWIPEAAYALKINADHNPQYLDRANFWTDYIVNQFLVKWEARGGLDRSLVHPYTNFMRMYYYLYKLTGNSLYLAEADHRADVLNSMMEELETDNGVAFTWDHRVVGEGEPYGCQPTVYALITVATFQDLSLEGYGRYADDAYMTHYAATFRDIVARYGTDQLAGDVCGDGDEGFEKFMLSSIPGLAAWDGTGQLLELSEQAYNTEENPSSPVRIFIPAYMLQGLAPSSGDLP